MVLSGETPAGTNLPSERDLMERFGVGRSTVREALFALKKRGLLAVNGGARARVTSPDARIVLSELNPVVRHMLARPDGVRHFQHARALLEVALAREAALRAAEDGIGRISAASRPTGARSTTRLCSPRPTWNFIWRLPAPAAIHCSPLCTTRCSIGSRISAGSAAAPGPIRDRLSQAQARPRRHRPARRRRSDVCDGGPSRQRRAQLLARAGAGLRNRARRQALSRDNPAVQESQPTRRNQ